MQFQTKKSSKFSYFLSQPHQPFFGLGFINALIFMVLFTGIYRGSIDISIEHNLFHAYSMIFLIFTNFFLGFLFTTFPRFSGVEAIEKRKYLIVFTFSFASAVAFLGVLFIKEAFIISSLFMIFAQVISISIFYKIYQKATLPKYDQYWIITAFGMGLFSNIVFLLSTVSKGNSAFVYHKTAVDFGIYLYLIFLAFSVSARMIPFFSHRIIQKDMKLLPFVFILFLAHSFLEGLYPKAVFAVDLTAAIIIAKEIIRWKLPFPNKEPLLWILHISVFWLPLALAVGSFAEFFKEWFGIYLFALPLHLLSLGYLTTLLIGFGTRVTIGHSGNILKVDRVTKYIFYFTQIVVLGRIIFSIAAYFGKTSPFFDISITLWLFLFGWWGVKYFNVLFFGKSLKN